MVRHNGDDPEGDRLEAAILALLDRRADGATICPSEAARAVHATRPVGEDGRAPAGDPVDPDGWRALMEPARRAARRLVASGAVEVTQRGQVVDAETATGPIRIRHRR